MLKFYNKVDEKNCECRISMCSIGSGIQMELDSERPDGVPEQATILLTPMDAAYVSGYIGRGDDCSAGHSRTGETFDIYYRSFTKEADHKKGLSDIEFVGDMWSGWIVAGPVKMAVPDFVLLAIKNAIDAMMPSLMYASTGDMEEEFG